MSDVGPENNNGGFAMGNAISLLPGKVLAMLFAASAAIALAAPPIQPTLRIPQARSLIPTLTSVIPPGPRVSPGFEPAYMIPRGIEFADFNGDGLLDMVVTPGFPQHLPRLPIAIWVNKGDGTFYDGTAEVIEGAPPVTWNAVPFIGDFNNDGRPDVFFLMSGAEHAVEDGLIDSGFNNALLLSQPNGKYRDATSQIGSNARLFNHQGGLGDASGDGNLDVALAGFGTTLTPSNGVKLLLGDGNGTLIDASDKLPTEIRFMPDSERPGDLAFPLFEYQLAGCAALVDVDGDGKAEVLSGSYSRPDRNGTRTIRFHKLGEDGNYAERARVAIPGAIAGVLYGYDPEPPWSGLGCSQIVGGDFNGDGRNDVLVQWEGNGKWYHQLLRNDGNFQFTDITVEALGSFHAGFELPGGIPMGISHYRLMDVNGDGALDIVGKLGGTTIDQILPHVVFLNDGMGHFTPWNPLGPSGPLTSAQLLSASKCQNCLYLPLVFDSNGSGVASLVLMDFMSLVSTDSPSQTTGVYLTNFQPFYTSNKERLFAWAEARAPQLFSPPATTFEYLGYQVRGYANGIYLGMLGDDVYIYGPPWGPALVYIGKVADYLPLAIQDGF